MGARILVVEDEKEIAKLLKFNLEKEGFSTLLAHDGRLGLELAEKEKPDLIVLDLMLPSMGGMEICRTLRRTSNVPIIMLTARSEEVERILGLEIGADDFVTKPFSPRELTARVKAVLRRGRASAPAETASRIGELVIDLDRYTVNLKGKPVALSSKEFHFLKVLVRANGKALPREKLLEEIWGYDRSFEIDTRTIDQHIARLRTKLGSESRRIVTVKNVGYRLDLL